MALKLKLKSFIGSRQESLQTSVEESVTDILTIGANVTKNKVEIKPVNPQEEQEIIDSIEEHYYKYETFDTSLHELQKLPQQLDADKITDDCIKLRNQLQAVSRRVSELILQNHLAYATELQQVMELQRTLKSAGAVCQSGREQLNYARQNFTVASLGLLSNYRKKQQLTGLLKSLRTIKTLQRTDLRLREMMEEDDFCGAIHLCQECQKASSTLKHYKCISELSSKLQDTLETIEEQLDVALSKTCYHFDDQHYSKVQRAYRQLGKTEMAVDQLLMHFTSTIHNTAFTILLGYVELTSGSAGSANLQKRPYDDLCKNITTETFTPCLVDLCKALWEIMKSYFKTINWHTLNDQDVSSGDSEVFHQRYVDKKLEHGRSRIWEDVQQRVKKFVLATNLSGFKFDEFIYILDVVNRMIEIGEEFCGSKSEGLQDTLKRQSLKYFLTHHQIRLDELRMFLENEAWEMCPVRSNFNILHLAEFRFMRKWADSRHLISDNELQTEISETVDQESKSYFISYLQEGNPFDKQFEEEEKEDFFSAINENDGETLSDSDSDIAEDLKKDYIDEITGQAHSYKHNKRRSSNRSKLHKQTALITNTTLNVLRVMGKYLQMISILKPIAFDVISSLTQLFDYYLYTVFTFFVPESNERAVNTRLLNTLQRIRDNLLASPSTNIPSNKDSENTPDKVMAAKMSTVVDLSNPNYLYGLAERVVATESLMFLAKQLDYLQPYLEELIPVTKKTFLTQFYSQTIKMAPELRPPVYGVVSGLSVNYDSIVQQMSTVKWDVKEIMSQHNTYIDSLLKCFTELGKKLEDVDKRVPLPKVVLKLFWEQCVRNANRTFVEGFASAKKCSNEGRALMQLDFQQFLTKLDQIIELRPIPDKEFVEAYIKAYYLPEEQLETWINDHKEYSTKQLLALVNSVDHLTRKFRQKLSNIIEETEKGRRT